MFAKRAILSMRRFYGYNEHFLPDPLREFVEKCVSDGGYSTASDLP